MDRYSDVLSLLQQRRLEAQRAQRMWQATYPPAGAIQADKIISMLATIPHGKRLLTTNTSPKPGLNGWLHNQFSIVAHFLHSRGRAHRLACGYHVLFAHHYKIAHRRGPVHVYR